MGTLAMGNEELVLEIVKINDFLPSPMPDARCPMPDARCPMPYSQLN